MLKFALAAGAGALVGAGLSGLMLLVLVPPPPAAEVEAPAERHATWDRRGLPYQATVGGFTDAGLDWPEPSTPEPGLVPMDAVRDADGTPAIPSRVD